MSGDHSNSAGPFLERLSHGPAVLLVGQRYLEGADGFDPFADALTRRLGSPDSANAYDALFAVGPQDAEATNAWLAELSLRLQIPDRSRPVVDFAWNAIYSSAVDLVLANALRNEWRDVQPVRSDRYRPANPRNPFKVALSYLFGAVGAGERDEMPPFSALEMLRRKQVMTALLRRIAEDVTPAGTLVVVGYDAERDWLTPDELAGTFGDFEPGQVHIFGTHSLSLLNHPVLAQLASAQVLTLYESPAEQVLGRAKEDGILSPSLSGVYAEIDRAINIKGQPASIPKSIWNDLLRSAIPIVVNNLGTPPKVSKDANYAEFRRFLETADGVPRWEGLRRGYYFRRKFFPALEDLVLRRLGERTLSERPVIVHGPAGTGKSVTLGALALSIAERKQFPVLFIHSRIANPSWRDVDRFVEWSESSGSEAALIVWDGMSDHAEYAAMARQLASRGRQVVVVGSSYELDTPPASSVLASGYVDQDELGALSEWLEGIDPSAEERLPPRESDTRYWLPLLYRALPPTRSALRSAVAREADAADARVRVAAAATDTSAPLSAIQAAMLAAGLVTRDDLAVSDSVTLAGELVDAVTALTTLVMVPGRFGLFPPVELLMRAVGATYSHGFSTALRSSSVLIWYEDQVGNVTIGPRNTLEAEIISQARLGASSAEVAAASRLLNAVKDDSALGGDGPEIRFAYQLVRALGPQGPAPARYRTYWLNLADALASLRTERSVISPFLMLHEANLRREWARSAEMAARETIEDQLTLATETAQAGLALLPAGVPRVRHIRSMLLVELAAAAGAKLSGAGTSDADERLAGELEIAVDALAQARQNEPSNYYPIDVLFWITRNLINIGWLADASKAEALASLSNAFLTADPETFPPDQQERYHSRQLELAELLDDTDLEDSAWDSLTSLGSAAGYYLRALRIAKLGRIFDPASVTQSAAEAFEYLQTNAELIRRDVRCIELRLDLWWLSKTGRRLVAGERQTVAFSGEDWLTALTLISAAEATGRSQRPLVLLYLRAIAEFHLGRIGQAFQVLNDLESLSEAEVGRKRIVRTYRASTPEGLARTFHGTVASITDDGRDGTVHVPELGRRLRFFPRDFGWPDLRLGDDLGDFYIAFNMRGVSVDSPKRTSDSLSREQKSRDRDPER